MPKKTLEKFIEWLRERNLTKSTEKNYVEGVRHYGEKNELNTKQISEYFRKSKLQHSPGMMKRRCIALKSWVKFQKLRNIDWKIVSKIIPSCQNNFFDTIDKEELELLKKVRFEVKEKNYQRNNFILDFFFYTGIRASELINVKHCDYDPKRKTLRILGKGNKVRYILLPTRLASEFEPKSSDYFFKNSLGIGTKLSLRTLERIIQERTKKSKINKIITPHSFRRSFATFLHNKKVHLTTIQKLLGHSNINTTIQYIHNNYDYLHQDYNKIWQE